MIEPLSECLHLKTMISSRYATFHRSLVQSKKLPVRFLARLTEKDNRTVLGRTLSRLMQFCEVNDDDMSRLNSSLIKKKMTYKDVPIDDDWRVNLGKELMKVRNGQVVDLPGFSTEECEEMLRYVCVA